MTRRGKAGRGWAWPGGARLGSARHGTGPRTVRTVRGYSQFYLASSQKVRANFSASSDDVRFAGPLPKYGRTLSSW
jgi:hypothetical protein